MEIKTPNKGRNNSWIDSTTTAIFENGQENQPMDLKFEMQELAAFS